MKIVLATFGSLGDMHPMNALGIELSRRGHTVKFAAMEYYREKIKALGFDFAPMRPEISPEDKAFAREIMDARTGTEKLLKKILLPSVRPQYEDLTKAVEGADLLITGEVVYAAKSVVEKTGVNWITTSLAPASFLSAHDPFLPPTAQWLGHLRFLGAGFHSFIYGTIRGLVKTWLTDYRAFRRELNLDEDHDPVFGGKFSNLLHLALFSKVLGKPQPDWHRPTLQCGFCFYDGKDDLGKMPEKLSEFLEAGEPPVVFTLGSAAVMDSRDFFEQSARAARALGRRAVLLYGVFNEPPAGMSDEVVAFDYAPFSLVFPRAAAVVHQGGVGTTGQVLRAGVPHLIMPYSHDQPDNAARCVRLGVARAIRRESYTAETAARELRALLSRESYREKAAEASLVVKAERGTETACDAIENIMRTRARKDRAPTGN